MEQAARPLLSNLRTAWHVVGMAILALASPYVWYGSDRLLTWFATIVTPLVFAAVAFGVYALLFRESAKAAWPSRFFMLAWVFLGLAVASPYLELFNKRLASQSSATQVQPAPAVVNSPASPPAAQPDVQPRITPGNPFADPNYGKDLPPAAR